ncbi:DNA mismatch repair protein MutS [Hazenella coriacea]|uniref:DNA mismatch repair protein MutS n=1 Tax=Hazenella coriacea TaxID=1179467 RepID=A0A4R3L4E5_9BACL|nr:DNA mismatch repair protein MutS [Hazenella coriacea]TCS93805.1 DNA mismatch repair protein MutS [Hazenella coriacea]
MAQYTPMIQQYLAIKAQHPDAFLFFRLGDFYEMFFEDAEKAAEELEITLTGRDGGKGRVPMCGVPYHSAQTYVEKLIEKGYKVAICEQVEHPSAAKGVVKREVVRVITPGTIMEETMLHDQENNFLVSITYDGASIGIAAADLSTGECHVTEVNGSVDFVLDEISSYQPKEVVVDPELMDRISFIGPLQQRIRCLLTPYESKHEDQLQLDQELSRQFPSYLQVCTTPLLRKVMGLLFSYLQQTQKRSLGHLQRLNHYDAKQYMMLDDAARRNLELALTLGEGKKRGSLLWLLDRTATAMGSRMLKKWLDKPLLDRTAIQERQAVVQAFLDDFILLDEVQDHLKQVYDLERLSARVSYGSANARDLNALKRSLEKIPQLKEKLRQTTSPRLQQLGEEMDPCPDVCQWIEQAILDDPPISVKEGGIIKEGHDPQLDQLRSVQRDGKSWIAQLEKQEREITGIKSLKVGYNRVFGYYIEVTKSNLRLLPEGRYQRKQTLTNAERFITPELKEREQLILHAEEKSVDLEYELFTQVREQVAEHVHRLQSLAEKVAELDVLHAFASIARQYQYVCPMIHDGDHLKIQAGRHPVVEASSSSSSFIANDAELDATERQILLITGPNMAGKSTYMRQVALITLLAQIGSFVPAELAEVPIVDRIFTRIGAADDLVGGRSTFMVEMSETCHALKEATSRSLILLDEVGRGTSTYDGMALAHAIVEYIHDHIGAKTLFSTHYHELTQLDEPLSRLVNVHAKCVEKNGKVIFLHRIVPGGADRSYGIHVAELAGLPELVIERAKVLLAELENRFEKSGKDSSTDGQLSLFDWKPSQEKIIVKEVGLSEAEKEVLETLKSWDLMNHTPFESMQLLYQLKQKLND